MHCLPAFRHSHPLADGPERWLSGAAAAPGTQPAPRQARQREHVNAATLDGSAQGATAGVSVLTRDGLCRPQLQRKAFWDISHGARTHPPMTHARQPRPIADVSVPTGDIGGRGRGQERWGRGKRPQGPEGGGERGGGG